MRLRALSGSYRPVLSRVRVVLTLVVLSLVLVFVTIMLMIEEHLQEPLQLWADSRATNLTTLSIAKAVERVLATDTSKIDLIKPIQGSDGLVGLTYAWSDLLRIKVAVTEAAIEAVESISDQIIPIPLGELLGIRVLAASGPALHVRIIPVGAVLSNMRFDFLSQGINQVLHRIYVDVRVKMRVIAPFSSTEILVSEQIPITTELIQGRVPDAMINWSGSIEELRNRTPVQ